MKVTLNQSQLETAVLMYLNATGMEAHPEDVSFDFIAGRKKKDSDEEPEMKCQVSGIVDPHVAVVPKKATVVAPEDVAEVSEPDTLSSEEVLQQREGNVPVDTSGDVEADPDLDPEMSEEDDRFADLKSDEEKAEDAEQTASKETANAASLFAK